MVLSLSLSRMAGWHADGKRPGGTTDQRPLASTLELLGAASYLSGDLVSGTDYFRQAIALYRGLRDQQGLAASLMHVALGATFDTETPDVSLVEAVWYGEEALTIAQENDWRSEQAHVSSELAIGYGRKGEYARALELGEQGLALAGSLKHQAWISYAHAALGIVYLDLFALAKASAHLEQALSIAHTIGSQHLACFAARFLAIAPAEAGTAAAEINVVLDRALSGARRRRVSPDGSVFHVLAERSFPARGRSWRWRTATRRAPWSL